MKMPKISICIPTKNRSIFLQKCLHSICTQSSFIEEDSVEIVISDNNSNDNTQEIAEFYTNRYPTKIFYSKNEKDIGDKNFAKSLSLGKGDLLKLCNDSIIWEDGSLKEILEIIDLAKESKPILFFLNGHGYIDESSTVCNGHDEFINHVSYFETWIGSFSIWKIHLNELTDFDRYSHLHLTQVDVLHRLINKGNPVISLNKNYFSVQDVGSKGGYSLSKVFGNNYLSILSEYSNSISSQSFYNLRKRVLSELIIPYYLNKLHNFDKTDFEKHLTHFYNDDYYPDQLSRIRNLKSISSNDNGMSKSEVWRRANSHNETFLARDFDITKVTVGRKTYGPLNIWTWGSFNEKLSIGNFVSIGEDVKFLLGGNHEYNRISTYPFKVKYFDHSHEATSKGEITVEDDVWIGHGCLILSGVKIGKGSIIAAGSIVTKDVRSYAIYGGAPATFIKDRFDNPEVAEILSKINFSEIDDEFIAKNQELLTEELEIDLAKSFLQKLLDYKLTK
jgi:acetyltransferase-like isoleucine patch superfamily enzyme